MQPDLASFQRSFVQAIDQPVSGPLAVYRNTVIHGAVEALHANYPVAAQIVGTEMFEGIGAEFVAAYPPLSPVLALYGAEFADWIGKQPWSEDLPYLADVAKIERLHVESLMAGDGEALTDSVRKSPASQRLRLHPAVRFTWLQTPAMSIWLAHQRQIGSRIEPEWKPEGALFARPDPFCLHALRIGPAAHRILSGIRLGETVAQCLEVAARLYPAENSVPLFASLVNLGVIAAPAPERS